MAEPTPFAMASLFTRLTGKDVTFSQLTRPAVTKIKQLYGVYETVPAGATRIAQADLPLLGSLGGALVGFPPDSIAERLAEPQLDEMLRDAIHEILNIASTVISPDARVVFRSMYADPVYFPSEAVDTFRNPLYRSYFNVAVQGYTGGAFAIFG